MYRQRSHVPSQICDRQDGLYPDAMTCPRRGLGCLAAAARHCAYTVPPQATLRCVLLLGSRGAHGYVQLPQARHWQDNPPASRLSYENVLVGQRGHAAAVQRAYSLLKAQEGRGSLAWPCPATLVKHRTCRHQRRAVSDLPSPCGDPSWAMLCCRPLRHHQGPPPSPSSTRGALRKVKGRPSSPLGVYSVAMMLDARAPRAIPPKARPPASCCL